MGNSSTKEARNSYPADGRQDRASQRVDGQDDGSAAQASSSGLTSRRGRARHDTGRLNNEAAAAAEPRKETKQEKEARRAQKERANRLKERERSLREESVDGGYLVTLGTYTGPEDFSKPTVRQLMLERRLAPFWRGLNDHSDSWAEHQLVAAARGLPIPAPDEIPPEIDLQPSSPSASSTTKPIPIYQTGPPQIPVSASFQGSSTAQPQPFSQSPLVRGRSKTLASLNLKNNDSQVELIPQEIKLPHEPFFNGQPIEARLYKDVMECPICFLYYPPHLNRTRCCDQPICSECFVQIKRPDPHPPEHLDPNSPVPEEVQRQGEEGQLVSEPAACPFCVQSEFGVTYEPPPFRRGLAYSNNTFSKSPLAASTSPGSAGGSLPGFTRRRGQSLSTTAPGVITTDRVRPDWAKKLSDARNHAARRSAAASALHAAAYMMGGEGNSNRLGGFGRRRRHFIMDSNGDGAPGEGGVVPNLEMLMAALAGADEGSSSSSRGRRGPVGLHPSLDGGRMGSQGNPTDEIEELMLREAIRLSLAAEEDRKRKEEKEAAKQAKRDEKARAKEQKKADKGSSKKIGVNLGSIYSSASANASALFGGGGGGSASSPPVSPSLPNVEEGKGKQRASPSGGGPASGSALNSPLSSSPTGIDASNNGAPSTPTIRMVSRSDVGSPDHGDAPVPSSPLAMSSSIMTRPRGLSELSTSSVASSMSAERVASSIDTYQNQSMSYDTTREGAAPTISSKTGSDSAGHESTAFNFGSLAAIIDDDGKGKEKDTMAAAGQQELEARQPQD